MFALGKANTVQPMEDFLIYLYHTLIYDINIISVNSETFEGMFIKILNDNGRNFYLGNIYRPPRNNNSELSIQTFRNYLNPCLQNLNKLHSDVILVGDFNINLLKYNDQVGSKIFLQNMFSIGMIPNISLPTRITDSRATLIDNVYTNIEMNNNLSCSGALISNISDHLPYFYCFSSDLHQQERTHKYIYRRKFNDSNIYKFYKYLVEKNIITKLNQDITADPNSNYEILEEYLNIGMEKFMPLCKIKYNKYKHKKSLWISYGILKSIKYRDKLYKNLKCMSKTSPCYANTKLNLKTYNTILKQTIRHAKYIFYNYQFNKYKNDTKKTWATIKEVINKRDSRSIPEYINSNNHRVMDIEFIANLFNDYFTQIGPQMAQTVPVVNNISFKHFLKDKTDTIFKFNPVHNSDIKKIILDLNSKTSSGHGNISTVLLKCLEPILTPILTLIINQSLNSGIFPKKLKIAKIVPLHKKDDIHTIENYRPISLLSSISKVFEKVVFIQLSKYFNKNEYLSKINMVFDLYIPQSLLILKLLIK